MTGHVRDRVVVTFKLIWGISLKKVTWEEKDIKKESKAGKSGKSNLEGNRKPKCPGGAKSRVVQEQEESRARVGSSRDEVRDVRWEVPSHCPREDVPSCSSGCCVMHRQKEGKG